MENKRGRRVGIMGGTFDPVHIGHLILGEMAYLQFKLDTVLFMPSGNPPHKKERAGRATTRERIDMVKKAISNNPHFELSLAEAHDEGYTYTKETLLRLKSVNPDTEYYFIMGADSLFSFETWKEPQEICNLCTLIAAVRNQITSEQLDTQIKYLKEKFHSRILKLDTPNIDVSSKTLRKWKNCGKSLRYYVPDDVLQYIEEKNLYKECEML